jgi:hypothetical protein
MSDTLEALKRLHVEDPDKEIARIMKKYRRDMRMLDLKEHMGLALIKGVGVGVFGGLIWLVTRCSS